MLEMMKIKKVLIKNLSNYHNLKIAGGAQRQVQMQEYLSQME